MRDHKTLRQAFITFGLFAALTPAVLAGDPFRDEPGPAGPPKIAFGEFETVFMREMTMNPSYPDTKSNAAAKDTLEQCLSSEMHGVFDGLQTIAADAPTENRAAALAIEPHIEAIKFVSGKARFWGGAMAGNSGLRLKVTYRDLESGEVIAEPVFLRRANAVKGSLSVGKSDRKMLQAICREVVGYAREHVGTRTASRTAR